MANGLLFEKTDMEGIESIIPTPRRPPANILVYGGSGTYKTLFCHTLLSRYLSGSKGTEAGMYITLEENRRSHGMNVGSLKIPFPSGGRYIINDFTDIRDAELFFETLSKDSKKAEAVVAAQSKPESNLDKVFEELGLGDEIKKIEEKQKEQEKRPEERVDYLDLIYKNIEFQRDFWKKNGVKFSIIVLDSFMALESLMEGIRTRKQLYNFFAKLRDQFELFALLIMEKHGVEISTLERDARYLSDGIIHLTVERELFKAHRAITVEKIRGCAHDDFPHGVKVFKDKGVVIGGRFVEAAAAKKR